MSIVDTVLNFINKTLYLCLFLFRTIYITPKQWDSLDETASTKTFPFSPQCSPVCSSFFLFHQVYLASVIFVPLLLSTFPLIFIELLDFLWRFDAVVTSVAFFFAFLALSRSLFIRRKVCVSRWRPVVKFMFDTGRLFTDIYGFNITKSISPRPEPFRTRLHSFTSSPYGFLSGFVATFYFKCNILTINLGIAYIYCILLRGK